MGEGHSVTVNLVQVQGRHTSCADLGHSDSSLTRPRLMRELETLTHPKMASGYIRQAEA